MTLELDDGRVWIHFDGAVVETFHDDYDKSFRSPATWFGVKAEGRKHDQVRFSIGRAGPGRGPLYGSDVELQWTDVLVDVPMSEEPRMRDFLTAIAQAVTDSAASGGR